MKMQDSQQVTPTDSHQREFTPTQTDFDLHKWNYIPSYLYILSNLALLLYTFIFYFQIFCIYIVTSIYHYTRCKTCWDANGMGLK